MSKLLFMLIVLQMVYVNAYAKCEERQYYNTGELQYINECSEGKLNGIKTQYSKSGAVIQVANYKDGVLHGTLTYYKTGGKRVAFKETYNGGIMTISELFGHDNDALSQRTTYKNTNGSYIDERFSKDGVLRRTSEFNNYALDGKCMFYTSDGKQEYEVYFKAGELVDGYKYIDSQRIEIEMNDLNKLLIELKVMEEPGGEC